MDADEVLGLSCAERGWRFRRLDGQLFIFDERSEQLARVDERIAEALSMSAPDVALTDIVDHLPKTEIFSTSSVSIRNETAVVSLNLLGVRVDVHCAYQQCADGIRDFYSASLVDPSLSGPEVVVWCELATAARHLFRARSDDMAGVPLQGVSVQTLRSSREEWTSTLPPLPALGSWPFRDRFAALHAAAVRTVAGEGVLIAGDRGSGKSTAAVMLSRRLGAEVLCDETAFLHCRSSVVESFPHAVGVWRGGHKVQVPITELSVRICRSAVPASRLVFLERRTEGSRQIHRLSRSASLRALLPHHRAAGASMGDAMQTLLGLAAECESWIIAYSNTDELSDVVCDLVS